MRPQSAGRLEQKCLWILESREAWQLLPREEGRALHARCRERLLQVGWLGYPILTCATSKDIFSILGMARLAGPCCRSKIQALRRAVNVERLRLWPNVFDPVSSAAHD